MRMLIDRLIATLRHPRDGVWYQWRPFWRVKLIDGNWSINELGTIYRRRTREHGLEYTQVFDEDRLP